MSVCVNWRRRSFRYKYLNETRVQIHAAHTKQMLPRVPALLQYLLRPAARSYRSPRCIWMCVTSRRCARCADLPTGCRRKTREREPSIDDAPPSCRRKLAKRRNTRRARACPFVYAISHTAIGCTVITGRETCRDISESEIGHALSKRAVLRKIVRVPRFSVPSSLASCLLRRYLHATLLLRARKIAGNIIFYEMYILISF